MSRHTEIVIGARKHFSDPLAAIAKLLEMLETDEPCTVTRTFGESHEFDLAWRCYKEEIDDPEEDSGHRDGVPPTDVSSLYVEGTALSVFLRSCAVFDRLDDEVHSLIDPVVIGEFGLNGPYFTVGGHDVFQAAYVDEPILLGRYFVSVTFAANGNPSDAAAVLEGILGLDEFRAFREQFESEFGPSEVVMTLDG
jgi:hypothetical protein